MERTRGVTLTTGRRRGLPAAAALLLLAACDSGATAPGPDASVRTSPDPSSLTVREVPPGESWDGAVQPLVVRVSNQSFDDPEVRLTATLDGAPLFDRSFAVEDQHTVTLFGVELAPGAYTLRVVSDSGAEVRQAVELPARGQRWVVVDYWYLDPDLEGTSWGGEETPGPSFHVTVAEGPVYIG